MAMILIAEENQVFKESFENPKVKASKKVECYESRKANNTSVKRKREMASDCEDLTPMDRAKAIQASLVPELPSFVKYMMPSHVTRSFCMGLPLQFCREQMPQEEDIIVMLEDENGDEFETKYLGRKAMLSGGWRGYAIAHNLKEGDVLVFQLVTPHKFKIYTVRACGSDELNGGDLEAIPDEIEGYEYDGIRLADSVIGFEEVTSIEKFNIVVNGLIINSEFPKEILSKYYNLCRSQQSYLHEHLLEGLYYKMVVAAIRGITTIADEIEACHVTPKQLATWDTLLQGFQVLGMNVHFLRARIQGQLLKTRSGGA